LPIARDATVTVNRRLTVPIGNRFIGHRSTGHRSEPVTGLNWWPVERWPMSRLPVMDGDRHRCIPTHSSQTQTPILLILTLGVMNKLSAWKGSYRFTFNIGSKNKRTVIDLVYERISNISSSSSNGKQYEKDMIDFNDLSKIEETIKISFYISHKVVNTTFIPNKGFSSL